MKEKRYCEVRLASVFAVMTAICAVIAIVLSTMAGVKAFQFYKHCQQHVINAQNAASPEIAIAELDIAIQYAEDTGRTDGYTCKFNANGDLKLWYTNLLQERANFEGLVGRSSDEFYFVDFQKVQENTEDIQFPSSISTYQTPILLYFGWFWVAAVIFGLAWLIEGTRYDEVVFKIPLPKKKEPTPAT